MEEVNPGEGMDKSKGAGPGEICLEDLNPELKTACARGLAVAGAGAGQDHPLPAGRPGCDDSVANRQRQDRGLPAADHPEDQSCEKCRPGAGSGAHPRTGPAGLSGFAGAGGGDRVEDGGGLWWLLS